MAPKPISPNEHLVIPEWINEEYFLPILKKDVKDFDKIVNFTPIAATAPGENYTSIMVRILMDILVKDGSEKRISYILKTGLDTNKGGAMVDQMGLFPKEMEMYQTYIPQFVKLYKEAGLDIELAPKCVHYEEIKDRITLVFEDLSRQNFRNIDRLKGFDLPHISCVLRKLAELHAASAVYRTVNGPYDERYYNSLFVEENRELFTSLSESNTATFMKAVKEWDIPESERFIKEFPSDTDAFEEGIRLNKVDESEFNVLNHGDSWSNNIMFNYKANGEIDRTVFVDLQMAKWGSPAQDLWYMIVTSASLDIKVTEFDHFIQIYHNRLTECLQLLNYSKRIPTLRDLHVMMIRRGSWGIFTATGVMVATLMPSDKDSNMGNMMGEGPEAEAHRYKTYTNPYYVKAMRQLLPFFHRKGILDY
ncbi:uncharacterized protein LOC110186672 [Drosophila serrata]|uniref:uncharacterized protein LOC110186672 n=1 Tax=Drosophila serrata TaxID=7274 RepID=UPI000A1D1F1C|nr:uncharacterized protein LOC110186672 [Drosophila serrata]XP_020811598.1 uncharacterized protein LOC110186672 [Drosophila serrata]